MTLRKATLILTCLGTLALLLTLSLATHYIIDASFQALEDEQARKNLERARNAVLDEEQRLDDVMVDWALWDDSVQFMRGRAKDFVSSNLNDRTLNSLRLRAILFLDAEGRMRWGTGFDPALGVQAPPPEGLREFLRPGSPLLVTGGVEDRVKGLLLLPQGVFLAAACPILDSEGRGPAAGTLIMLRQLGTRENAILAERIRLPLVLERADTPLPADVASLAAELEANGSLAVDDVGEAIMAGVMILPDMLDRPALRLVVREPRDVMTIGNQALNRTHVWMAFCSLAFLGALLLFLERRVLRRLQGLTRQVEAIGGGISGSGPDHVDMPGTDELAFLARRINDTLSELERSRRSLATQYALTEAQEGYLLQILDSIQAGVLLVDPQSGRILESNAFAAAAVGLPREEMIGRLCQGVICTDGSDGCAIGEPGRGGPQCLGSLQRADGSSLAVLKSASHIERGGRRLLLETFIDVEDLHRAQEALKRSEEVYRTIFMNTGTATMLIEADTTITLANQEFAKLAGVPRSELEGKRRWTEFFVPDDVEWMLRHHVKRRQSPDLAPRNYEARFVNSQGEVRTVLLTVAMIPDTQVSVAAIEDITERKKAEEQLRHQAFHDALTGLPNRLLLHDRLERCVETARREGDPVAVLLMDLDRFKDINDSLGHAMGDRLLTQVAQRLEGILRRSDTVARLGGDEFVVVMGQDGADAATRVCRHILESFDEPFDLEGQTLHVRVSIGAALFPEHGDTPGALLKNADLAMYRAKERGRNTFAFFTKELDEQVVQRLAAETALRRALESGGIEVHYQPKVALDGPDAPARITGAEALVRLRRKDGVLVSPAEFIGVAEDTGLIMPLSGQILREACRQAARWREVLPDFVLAVNLSPRLFLRPGLAAGALETVRAAGLPPEALEFEITENLLLDSRPENLAALDELAASGASVVLDDFGKEYSSLAYIKKLPIEAIKIDRAFIDDLPRDEDDAAIVKSILAMAETLELRVVAEGVETPEQLAFLTGLGCREFQGYLFSRPLPAAQLDALLGRAAPFGDPRSGLDADGAS
mgnify:CR=1 FL=1